MLDYATPAYDAGIVVVKHHSRIEFVDDLGEIGPYHVAYHQLSVAAPDADESIGFVRAALREIVH
jgi:hypothetical protein